MSQFTAVTTARPARTAPRPSGRTAPRVSAARLRVVSAPAHARSRAGLVAASLVTLAVGLIGLLLLNVSLEKGAFTRHTQQVKIDQLTEQRQALREDIANLEEPGSLARKAAQLGMVEAPNVAFVARDGRVLGVPSPGVAKRPAIVTPSGPSAGGRGAVTGSVPRVSSQGTGSAGSAAGKATASTKVTATGRAGTNAATTTSTSSGKPASSAGAKAPAPTSATGASTRHGTGHRAVTASPTTR